MRSDLFAQENHEVEGPGNFVKQSSKMMKVELAQGSVKALQGSMVAYVTFCLIHLPTPPAPWASKRTSPWSA